MSSKEQLPAMAPSPSSATSVQVALRIRPPTSHDSSFIPARFQRTVIHAASPTSVAVEVASGPSPGPATPKKQYFTFDQVHPPPTSQYELFISTAQPLVSRFLEGFNCTILAYGQTSSGKTFTMTGIDLDADPSDPHNGMGIIPRAVSHIFARARQLKDERGPAWTYGIKGSFVELYNEDLIDLLNMDDASGGKREVQIREDKDGHIIWGGLREVNVRNPNEVMTLIRKGTAIRRTNETDMNAQSSRSHAIFSLTLTQKKYTGSGPPPRSSSPLPPGRPASRLARPGSVYTSPPGAAGPRVGSPTFGRPPTPSFAIAMGRGGLRPSSALGHHGGDRLGVGDEDNGSDWVTIVSKFHFVDLAGSERLKRTAAIGDRIKEGISINSGLLALGNVISALGDPSRAKSHTASYVPYRDSKLTRLLQDSLGGNAHTLMIACVSPAEWNVAETINTLKYANRARNIKNRAVINEKEEGWDDVEWLQSTVTRLRKELKALKESGILPSSDHPVTEAEGGSKKVLAQMTELRNNYEDLREKFVERMEELARLRRELGVRQRESSGGAVGGTAKYEEIVGPVIEEYEKTISTMEAELSLNRAALRHTNELVEEKEEELVAMTERHSTTELYVEELKARVVKLTEREAHTEAYVRDLEEKMKLYDESSISSSESMSDLRREVSKFKDAEMYSTKYITDLEARLGRADESILELQQTVERLERECERRCDEAEVLQKRLDNLLRDGEGWCSDLEERERRVKELEEKLSEWQKKSNDAGQARERLGNVVEEVVSARRSLEIDLAKTSNPSPPKDLNGDSFAHEATRSPSELALESQLSALQQTHTATLADLASVSDKYRDSLREISDLAAQIQEAKLGTTSDTNDSPIGDTSIDFPPISRRRMTGSRPRDTPDLRLDTAARRLFYRQAVSTESLHQRSLSQSQSLSQELSSARTRQASLSSLASSSHSPSSSYSFATIHSTPPMRSDVSIVLSPAQERSSQSLEKEIMRLQEVLKERETEISLLEDSLKELQNDNSINGASEGNKQYLTVNGVNGDVAQPLAQLTPRTLHQFDNIREALTNGANHVASDEEGRGKSIMDNDESLERLNELMLSMAQKESQHKEVVDELTTQLNQVRRQLDDLTALSRDQALNMSMELEAMRKHYQEDLNLLAELQKHEADLVEQLKKVEADHAADVDALRKQHEEALLVKASEMGELVTKIKSEHETSISTLRTDLQAATSLLEQSRLDHEEAFGKLQKEREEELDRRVKAVEEVLQQTRDEHERALVRLRDEHAETLKQKEAEMTNTLHGTEEEYYNALTKLRGDHAEAIKQLTAETNATIERLREEHAGQLRMAEIAREGSLVESQSSFNVTLKELQDEHAAAVSRKGASFAEEIEGLKSSHARLLKAQEDDHTLQLDRIRLEYESTLAKLKEEWRLEVERLKSSLASQQEQEAYSAKAAQKEKEASLQHSQELHASATSELKQQHSLDIARLEARVKDAQGQSAATITEYERKLEAEITELTAVHGTALKDSIIEFEQKQSAIVQSHARELEQLRSQHEREVADAKGALEIQRKEYQDNLQEARAEAQRSVKAERDFFESELDDLNRRHAAEMDTLRGERTLLEEEIETQKVALYDFSLLQDETLQHEETLNEKSNKIQSLEQQLSNVSKEKDDLWAEASQLRAELDKTRSEQSQLVHEASKRQSLVDELERHRAMIADLQENLQRVKDEKDVLQSEKQRTDGFLKELQAQVARSSSPPNARPTPERSLTYPRSTGLTALKLPPPTPPPTMPPPPAPRSATHVNGDSIMSTSSQSSSAMSPSTPSRESQPDTPATSISQGLANGAPATPDAKLTAKVEQQSKQIEEQEAMIKTLNKQLTHCESDLQAHMDLVSTLESSLSDSEKNLRKARMHATELARERDSLNNQIEALKNDLNQAKHEVVSVRRSIVEEKQSLEQRLDEERKAKERVRQQLDSRMEELQRRKSKFACL